MALGSSSSYQTIQGGSDDPNANAIEKANDVTLLNNVSGASNEDYYQQVVINALVGVLEDSTQQTIHYDAVEAVMLIFRTQRLRCVSYLPQVSASVPIALSSADPACLPRSYSSRSDSPSKRVPQTTGKISSP